MNDFTADRLELEALLLGRTYLYELFFRLLGATPDRRMLDVLAAPQTRDVFDEYAQESAPLGRLRDIVDDFVARRVADGGASLDTLRNEHTRLFLASGVLPCPVQEGPYLTHENTLMQQTSVDVRRAYHSCGLRPVHEGSFPDDHVAMMCGFMARMAQRAREAFAAGDTAGLQATLGEQRAFVAGHMATWLGDFARAVRFNSKTAVLYPQLIEGLAVFVGLDVGFCVQASTWVEGSNAGPSDVDSKTRAALDAVASKLDELRTIEPLGLDDFALREVTGA